MKHANTLGAVVLGAGLVAGCSGAAPSEDVGRSNAAVTLDTASFSVDSGTYQGIVDWCDFSTSTLSFASGTVTFTPSTGMLSCMRDAGASGHAMSLPVSSFNVNAPAPFGPYTVTVTALSMWNLSTDLQPSAAHVHADFSATLHMYSPNILQPTFDVVLSDVAADALFGLTGDYQPSTGEETPPAVTNGSNGSLTASLAIALPGTVTVQNCLLGTCDSLIHSQLGNVASELQSELQPELQTAVQNPAPYTSNPGPYQGFLNAIAGYEAFLNPSLKGWSVTEWPSISDSILTFGMIGAPPVPTGCTESDSCYSPDTQGSIEVACAAAQDPLTLEYLASTGQWEPSGVNVLGTMTQFNATTSEAFTFRVCATNAVTTTCTAPFSYTTPATYWCAAPGGNLGGGIFGGSSGGNSNCSKGHCLE